MTLIKRVRNLRWPSSGGGGGTSLTHGVAGATVTVPVSSRSFAAPRVWDNGADAAVGSFSSQYSEAQPSTAGSTYNMVNRSLPLSTAGGTIGKPHNRTSICTAGCHIGENTGSGGNDVMTAATFTRPSFPFYLFAKWHERVAPNALYQTGYAENDFNHKFATYGNGLSVYADDYWYLAMLLGNADQFSISQSGGIENPDQNSNNALWSVINDAKADGWQMRELEVEVTDQHSGRIYFRENNATGMQEAPGYYEGITDGMTGTDRYFSWGGYWRAMGADTQWRAYADTFLQVTTDSNARLMLTDTSTYSACPKPAPQIISGISSGVATFTPNFADLTAPGTGYLWWVSFRNGATALESRVLN